jgi:transposase
MRVLRTTRRYDQVFREDALALVRRSGRSLKSVSESLGIPFGTLRYWYDEDMAKRGKKARPGSGEPSVEETLDEKVARLERENAVLRKKNDQLEMDRAILKKAAAFFAKENE